MLMQVAPENAPVEWRLSEAGTEALAHWLETHISAFEEFDKPAYVSVASGDMIENFKDSGQLYYEATPADTTSGSYEYFMLPRACLEAVRVIREGEEK
ncbi:MAG: hypothetical protein NC080_07275 [Paraprevotella sp.]|nr:hypothetical protein [Paraprevotella sp.]